MNTAASSSTPLLPPKQEGIPPKIKERNESMAAAANEVGAVAGRSSQESSAPPYVEEEGSGKAHHPHDTSRVTDEGDEEDDLVAIPAHETMLQEGAYRQVGGTEVRKLDRSKLIRKISINILLIASWFFFSTLMNLYNSWLFSKKRQNFSYPLFTTAMHMAVQFALSSAFMIACRRNRKFVPRQRNGQRARPSAQDYVTKVVPCALSTALDIGLSNLSLQTITLTFYTMCKSSNLAFVLLFAFLFGLEKLRLSLIGIITLITIGVIMMVAAETEFVLEGAVEVLTASAMGGLRWALMQILIKRKNMGMSNPIATMFWLSPLMGVFMLIGSLAIEHWSTMLTSPFFKDAGTTFHTLLLLLTPGLIVFCMNLCEFTLIARTSVMTLSVAGIFKEILTIMISSTVFGDELTPINVTGLCIAILGIAFYNIYKYRLLMAKTKEGGGAANAHGVEYEVAEEEDEEEVESGRDRYTEMNGSVLSTKASGSLTIGRRASHPIDGDARVTPSITLDAEDEDEEALLTEAQREKRRKRQEEADMDGWQSSGFQRTGNGWDDDRHSFDSGSTVR